MGEQLSIIVGTNEDLKRMTNLKLSVFLLIQKYSHNCLICPKHRPETCIRFPGSRPHF